jgi:hypothetical protein
MENIRMGFNFEHIYMGRLMSVSLQRVGSKSWMALLWLPVLPVDLLESGGYPAPSIGASDQTRGRRLSRG